MTLLSIAAVIASLALGTLAVAAAVLAWRRLLNAQETASAPAPESAAAVAVRVSELEGRVEAVERRMTSLAADAERHLQKANARLRRAQAASEEEEEEDPSPAGAPAPVAPERPLTRADILQRRRAR